MRCRRPHLHSPALSALLGALVFFNASVAAADGFVVSGHSGSLYDGDEWSELLRSLATVLFIFTVDDEDDSDFLCDPHHYHDPDDWCDVLGFSVPQVQLSAGVGYTLSPRLTVGARYLYRRDRRDNEIARLWGGGPEVTLDLGDPGSAVQPFVGGYLLATRGERRRESHPLSQGTSFGVQAGLRVMMSPGAGLLLQWGFQNDRFPDRVQAPVESRSATVGLGLRLALE